MSNNNESKTNKYVMDQIDALGELEVVRVNSTTRFKYTQEDLEWLKTSFNINFSKNCVPPEFELGLGGAEDTISAIWMFNNWNVFLDINIEERCAIFVEVNLFNGDKTRTCILDLNDANCWNVINQSIRGHYKNDKPKNNKKSKSDSSVRSSSATLLSVQANRNIMLERLLKEEIGGHEHENGITIKFDYRENLKHNGTTSTDLKFFYKGYSLNFTNDAVIIYFAHSPRNRNKFTKVLGESNGIICIKYSESRGLDQFTTIVNILKNNQWLGNIKE